MGNEQAARPDRRVTDTRARIEQVALELFATKGFSATSLRDIAEALGLTKAALYYHFPAKADLARAVFQPIVDDVDAFLESVEGRGLPPRELLEAHIDMLAPHRAAFLALMRDPSGLAYVDLEPAILRWLDRFQDLLLGPDPTPAERVRAIVAVGGLSRCVLLTNVSMEEVRTAGVDAALAALGETA